MMSVYETAFPFILYLVLMPSFFHLVFKSSPFCRDRDDRNCGRYYFNWRCFFITAAAYLYFILFYVFIKIGPEGIGGNDSFVYLTRFQEADGPLLESLFKQDNEPGYGLLIWLIRNFTGNYRVVLLFNYTVIFLCQLYFFRHFYWDKYSFMSYVLLSLVTLTGICILRIVLCIHIALIIFIKIKETKYLQALLLTAIAVSIHLSAVILFPVIVICKLFRNNIYHKKWFWLFYPGAMLLLALVLKISEVIIRNTKYSIYIGDGGPAIASYLIYLLLIICLMFRISGMAERNRDVMMWLTVLSTAFFVCLIQFKYGIAYRMLLFYEPVVMLLITFLMREYSAFRYVNRDNLGFLIHIGLTLILGIRLIGFFGKSVYAYGLYPYHNILFEMILTL